MKKLYTLFILLISSILFGQEYRPLLGQNNFWEVHTLHTGTEISKCKERAKLNDIILEVNGKEYHNLEFQSKCWYPDWQAEPAWGSWNNSHVYLSENISEKKVYVYYEDINDEFLLYDFNLEVGDIVPLGGFPHYIGEGEEQHVTVTAITYENIYGLENVKTFHTNFDSSNHAFYEGIGNTDGLYTLTSLENYYSLIIFNPLLGITESNQTKTKIYPNPFSDKIQIQNSEEIKELQLFDLQGKLISANKNLDELNSKLPTLNNAVYLLRITFKNNKSETIKLIKNH